MNTIVKYGLIAAMKLLSIQVLLLFIFTSCEKLNPTEPIPAYIKINSFTISDSNLVGTKSERITDAWVTHNGNILGVFELPALVPIIPEDSNQIFLKAGVMSNGIVETRVAYPFFLPYIENIDLSPEVTTLISPEVAYRSDDQMEILYENSFESDSIRVDILTLSHIEPKFSTEEVFEGSKALHLGLTGDQGDSLAQFIMSDPFTYPLTSGDPAVMLEMNYKCDHNFSIGVYLDNGPDQELRRFLTIKSTNGAWKKNYFNLRGTMSALEYVQHRFTVEALLNKDSTAANIFIDNIKILSTK